MGESASKLQKSFNKCGSKLLCIIMETVCQYTHFNSIWDEFHYIYQECTHFIND